MKQLTETQRALILALEAIRPSRSELPSWSDLHAALTEIAETYMNDPGQRLALAGDVEALFQANLARLLGDPACPFCTAEMRDGRCPGCGHDPSTRRG